MALAVDLGVADVLDVAVNIFGIDGEVHRDELNFLCPVHNDASPSADVNLVTGLWSCFSCGARGDLAGLGSVVLKKPRDVVVGLLRPGTPDAVLASVQRRISKAREGAGTAPKKHPAHENLHRPDQYASGPLTYMYDREFNKRTMRRWGVRFVKRAKVLMDDGADTYFVTIRDSVAIPIKDIDGKLVAWCYRRTDASPSWQPRYFYTPEFDLSSNWFGIHLHGKASDIHVVEGPLDAMWLDQHGYPALAMMGSNHRSPRKFRVLERYGGVVTVPDYDAGGVWMANNIGSLLRGRVPVRVARWPRTVVLHTGKDCPDPQDVRRPEDLALIVSRAIPWQAWRLRLGLPTTGN